MTGPTAVVRRVVDERAGGHCEYCGLTLGYYRSRHHRIPRGAGGSRDPRINQPSNLVVLCGSATSPGGCHWWAESRRSNAIADGVILHRGTNPSEAPILYRGRWCLLTDDGSTTPLPEYEETRQRWFLGLSILQQRDPSADNLALAVRALQGAGIDELMTEGGR